MNMNVNNKDIERLENFINGIGATRLLLGRAHRQRSLIEAIILYATLIDGFCRMALVLKEQIDNKSPNFNVGYIYQNNDKYYSERDIYKLAQEKFILEKDLFDDVNALYDFRNKIIHRFLISEIEYEHLGLVLDKYELVFNRLWNIVYGLESDQIYRGIGMTIANKLIDDDKEVMRNDILKKIGTKDPEKLKRILGSKLIHNMEAFSEEVEQRRILDEISDEVEISEEKMKIPPGFASIKEITKWAERRGLFQECVCGHMKIIHINMDKLKNDIKNSKKNKDLKNYLDKCKNQGCKCMNYQMK